MTVVSDEQERQGPLAGLRVVELAGLGPGPFCAMVLADLGAEVVRVDRLGGGLTIADRRKDVINRNRRSIAIDLKHPGAADVVLRLVERADVLIEGFRPGVAERLGLGPDACLTRNARLIYGRITGWGQSGPLARAAGHDIDYLAVTGALHAIGRAGGPPQVPVNYLGDYAGGALFLATGVLAALWEVRRSGRGQVVDAAIVDGVASLQAMTYAALASGTWQDQRGANLIDTGAPFYDVYETADERYMAVGAIEPHFYAQFFGLLFGADRPADLPDQTDRERWPELRERITSRFAERTQQEWVGVFRRTDACVAPVMSLREASQHPHLAARGTYIEVDGVIQPAPAPRFSRTPGVLDRRPALPGEHTRDVLSDWGFADIDELISRGIVAEHAESAPPRGTENQIQ